MSNRQYFGCKVRQRDDQRTISFFVFYAKAKDIKTWAGVRRVEDSSEGTQRVVVPARVKAIKRFLTSSTINAIPNNIIIAFNPGTADFVSLHTKIRDCVPEIDVMNNCEEHVEWGSIDFSFDENEFDEHKPAFVVDGQHRLFGVSDFQNEDIPLLVVSLLDAPLEEQAFQFVVINNKSTKVPTNNVKAIIANFDEQELSTRLLGAGITYGDKSPIFNDVDSREDSPFYKLLDWPNNREGLRLVPLTAIEQCIRHLRIVFNINDEDESSLVELFLAIWRGVQKEYTDFWGEDNKFMSKVNICALNEFLAEKLRAIWVAGFVDVDDSDLMEAQTVNVLKKLPKDFWLKEWSVKIQDNANVRNMIVKDLNTLAQNVRTKKGWHEGLKIIKDESLLAEDSSQLEN